MRVCCRYWIIPDITQTFSRKSYLIFWSHAHLSKLIDSCMKALDNSLFGELPQDILCQYCMPRPSAIILMGNLPKSDKTAILLVYLLVPNQIFRNLAWTYS